MPVISVIVPIYNAEKYLEGCIQSVLNQTYRNFELILIDDGSQDNSYKICKNYEKKDNRIILIHQKNQGQSVARNKGIQLAKGKWISFLDADDVIHPQMLEILLNNIRKTNANISMCGAEEGEKISAEFYSKKNPKFKKFEVSEAYLENIYQNVKYRYWIVWAKLINIDIVRKYPFTKGKVYEDNAVVCQWLYKAKTVVDTNEKLYFYRINYEGTTKSNFSKKRVDYLWALEQQISFYDKIQFNQMLEELCKFYLENATEIYKKVNYELKDRALQKKIYNDTKIIYKKYKKQIKFEKKQLIYTIGVFHPRIIRIYWLFVTIKNKIYK